MLFSYYIQTWLEVRILDLPDLDHEANVVEYDKANRAAASSGIGISNTPRSTNGFTFAVSPMISKGQREKNAVRPATHRYEGLVIGRCRKHSAGFINYTPNDS